METPEPSLAEYTPDPAAARRKVLEAQRVKRLCDWIKRTAPGRGGKYKTLREFAQRYGYSELYLFGVSNGHATGSKRLWKAIEEYTGEDMSNER